MKLHIQLAYGLDVKEYCRKYRAGSVPDFAPYGFHHAHSFCTGLSFSEDLSWGMLGDFFRRGIERILGFDLIHAFYNRRGILSSDAVWTMTEREYLAVAALLVLAKNQHTIVVGNTVWLFDRFSRLSPFFQYLFRRLAARMSAITVHSAANLPKAREAFPATRIELMYFGVSSEVFPVARNPKRNLIGSPIRIFAPGSDQTRDWSCLLDAFGNDDRFAVTVLCRHLPASLAKTYTNIRIINEPSMDQYKHFFAWADFAMIPMIPNSYSGITVALEAAAMGCCILSANTGGVPTYFDDTAVLYYPPGDSAAARQAVLGCSAERRAVLVELAQDVFEARDYSTVGLIARYKLLTEEFLAR